MTYSVGFRAPSLREIASSWFETVLETVPEAHYRDASCTRNRTARRSARTP